MDPSSLRLKTKWEDVYFNYHETWRPSKNPQTYLMDRAYLHLYLRDHEGMEELQALSLHCDPSIEKTDEHYRYRRGPHFHIGGASPSIDHAHLSLCVSDRALGGANLGALTRTFSESIGLVVAELIPQYVA
jgi:hypothetical protein